MEEDQSWKFVDVIRGFQEADLEEQFNAYGPALLKYTYRILGDEAMGAELFIDVFSGFLNAVEEGSIAKYEYRFYLYSAGYRLATTDPQYAKFTPGLRSSGDLEHLGRLISREVSPAGDPQFLSDLKDAFSGLTLSQRYAIILGYFEDLSLAETGLILGEKTNNVKQFRSRGLNALRKELGI